MTRGLSVLMSTTLGCPCQVAITTRHDHQSWTSWVHLGLASGLWDMKMWSQLKERAEVSQWGRM